DRRLIDYLRSRKINPDIARVYLKEIRYKPVGKENAYYALGFPSGESFEVRCKNFKGSVGIKKEISTLNLENNKSLSIFEGFMNFLAFLSHNGITEFQNSVIILNSVNLKDRALEVISGYEFSKIYLFLDNDEAGETAKQFFIDNIKETPVIDKSGLYTGYNDFNQMTMEIE
ncbi:MAG: toprim domain-containing protein, partial [Bacteroidia bacterium]